MNDCYRTLNIVILHRIFYISIACGLVSQYPSVLLFVWEANYDSRAA